MSRSHALTIVALMLLLVGAAGPLSAQEPEFKSAQVRAALARHGQNVAKLDAKHEAEKLAYLKGRLAEEARHLKELQTALRALRDEEEKTRLAAIIATVEERVATLTEKTTPLAVGQQELALPESVRTVAMNRKFLLYVPKEYMRQKSTPLLLFLHGMGERGNDLATLRRVAIPRLIAGGRDFPMLVASPQCLLGPDGKGWWNTADLIALVDHLEKECKVDPRRIYVTGLSMGGFATWDLACRHPKRFAAIVPVCGGGNPGAAGNLKDLPTWAFHGDKDTTVVLAKSQEMIDAIKAAGGNPKFTIYPGVGHNAWDQAYAEKDLVPWLLAQARP